LEIRSFVFGFGEGWGSENEILGFAQSELKTHAED
jgi:hypothetical protein